MYCIDVFDNGININGQRLTFPLSYDEIKTVLGEARLYHYGTNGDYISYVYDELGISFEGSTYYLNNLKKKKAYKDKEHTIIGLTLYVSGKNIYESFLDTMPEKCYLGNLTFLGQKIDQNKIWKSPLGYGYSPVYE